jgi:molecular chaperone Hsp33
MIKKKIYGNTLKEQLLASANDRLYKFLLDGGNLRGVLLNGVKMINEMRANHELGILETIILGRAYIACGLLSADLGGKDRIALNIECSGPVKGLNVEANAMNEIRGYLKNKTIPVDKPVNDFNLSPYFGAGFLTITKYLEDAKSPFTGNVMLKYGNIAQDLSYYFTVSEQKPTSITLSIQLDTDGNVTGAGGLFLQAMPGADENKIILLEETVKNINSLASLLSAGRKPDELIKEIFRDLSPDIRSNTRIEFMCYCMKERMLQYLSALSKNEISDIIKNGPFPVEIRCHNCNTKYYFEKDEIEQISETIVH